MLHNVKWLRLVNLTVAKVASLKRFRVFVIFLDVKNNTLVEIRNRWCAVGVDSVIPNKHLLELGYSNPYFTFPYLHYQVSCVAAAFYLHSGYQQALMLAG